MSHFIVDHDTMQLCRRCGHEAIAVFSTHPAVSPVLELVFCPRCEWVGDAGGATLPELGVRRTAPPAAEPR